MWHADNVAARAWIAHPHIGEYAAKTNAIRDGAPIPATPDCSPGGGAAAAIAGERVLAYCPWSFRTLSQALEILARFC